MIHNIVLNGIYRHFKGNRYQVIAIGTHTETHEDLVIYKGPNGKIWCRPLSMFTSKVDKEKYPNAKQEYRFELENKKNRVKQNSL